MLVLEAETALAARIAVGGEDALAARWELVLAYEPFVQKLVRHFVHRYDLVYDDWDSVAQDAAFTASSLWDAGRSRFGSFLWHAIPRDLLNEWRSRRRRTAREKAFPFQTGQNDTDAALVAQLREEMRELSSLERRVLHERFCRGASLRSVGRSMRVSRTSVLRLERQALTQLREALCDNT